jgi:hypothetical protein
VIEEQDVERAIQWMIDNATKAAEARANREYVEQFRKTLKAQVMKEHAASPLGVQEREAYADPRYVAHLDALRTAVEQDERMRWLMTAAETRVSAWQTQQRGLRAA